MIRNFVLLFVRNLKRQKLFSAINVLGLTVSIICTILIYLYVEFELSFDNFHPNSSRLYRVTQTFIWGENSESQFSRTGPGVVTALKAALPEVELITSLHTPGNFIFSYTTPGKEVISFHEDEVLAADSNFFKVFNFPLVKGSTSHAFTNINTLMLTESAAMRYFKNEDPIGKLLVINANDGKPAETFEVTGVLADVPPNSTIQFEVLLSMKNFPVEKLHWSWIWTQLETFVLLREDADIENVRTKLASIPRTYAEETLQRVMNVSYDDYIASGKRWDLFLQPVNKMHLPDQSVVGSFADVGNIKIIYSLIGAAIFIVLLSCINFMNLSTAQFTQRIREASIRNVLGLGKRQLSIGYFIEALLFCVSAVIIAVALSQILLPLFNVVTGKELSLSILLQGRTIAVLAALTIFMALISSAYPSLILTAFPAAEGIKGKLKSSSSGRMFRKGLVVFQFAISIILIASTAIVFQQLNYVSERDLGFNKANLVEVQHIEALKDTGGIKKSLSDIPGVLSASVCSSTPPTIFGGDAFGADGLNGKTFQLNFTTGDENFIPTLEVRLKYGRNFDVTNPADQQAVIINEATIKKLEWPDNETVLGKKIFVPGEQGRIEFQVIGVVSDFNYWSLQTSIDPMAIFHVANENVVGGKERKLAVRLDAANAGEYETILTKINNAWKMHAGDVPFDYTFVDESFAETFKTEQQFGNVLTVMAGLAVFIAGLGLFGMIVYSVEQRTKEIGIRKISGASVGNILVLIGSSYTKLIVISFIIGAPVSYMLMNNWLSDFAYRVTPSLLIFAWTGIATLILAVMITSFHAFKAALRNPVDVLRDE